MTGGLFAVRIKTDGQGIIRLRGQHLFLCFFAGTGADFCLCAEKYIGYAGFYLLFLSQHLYIFLQNGFFFCLSRLFSVERTINV